MKSKKLIRFDWAAKKLLRNKANFDILEGFLSVLLKQDIKIKSILESDGNKEDENDKFNRVDILVEDSEGALVIIEIQNSKEYSYFHRILFGSSKSITEYINEGEVYSKVKKIISITIAYFDLGQGEDYVYKGTTSFKGIHEGDILQLSAKQKELYEKQHVFQIFPEYWLLRVGTFDKEVHDKLDEWIYFLKTGEIDETFTAKGLSQAKEKLDKLNLNEQQKKEYKAYLRRLRDIASDHHNRKAEIEEALDEANEVLKKVKEEAKEDLKKAKEDLEKVKEEAKEDLEKIKEEAKEDLEEAKMDLAEMKAKAVIGFYLNGIAPEIIADTLGLSIDNVNEMILNYEHSKG